MFLLLMLERKELHVHVHVMIYVHNIIVMDFHQKIVTMKKIDS